MSRNTKREDYKVYLALNRRYDELLDIRRNLGYEELDNPIHHGYNGYLELREDVARRTDKVGNAIRFIVEKFAVETWSTTKQLYYKRGRYVVDNRPYIRKISEEEYERLHESVAKYFYAYTSDNIYHWSGFVRKKYTCILPSHFLVTKIKKSYITHRKVHDSELESEIAFVKDKLNEFWNKGGFWDYGSCYKKYRQKHNRRDRRADKVALRQNLHTILCNDSYENYKYRLEIFNEEVDYLNENSEDYVYEPYDGETEIEFYQDATYNEWSSVSGWECDPYEFKYKHRHKAKYNYW
jgi:hypothetical protein